MGSWKIYIEGHGCHHNGKPEIDADLASVKFVEVLQKQGHLVKKATFTLTGTKMDGSEFEPEDLLKNDEAPV